MTTQFSCGHWATDSEDIGVSVALKRQDVDEDGWKNVIHYATYCANCRYRVWYDGELLMNEEEEMNWLRGDMV
jgi:hypothetical protein